MSETILHIERWGNSLGLRIPASVARKAKLRASQRVNVSVIDGASSSHLGQTMP